MQPFFPIAIAAALLNIFVLAPHIGLRAPRGLHEVFGIGLVITCTLPTAALLDWLLQRFILQPTNLEFLRLFIAIVATAALTQLFDALVKIKYPQWFPPFGTHLPLATATACTLIATQIYCTPAAGILQTLIFVALSAIATVILLTTMQTLREQTTKNAPAMGKNLAVDVLSAAFILLALYGVLGVFQ